ncbi:hypothetical protein GGI35DRAFT_232440 [Trichoderma velutinum]
MCWPGLVRSVSYLALLVWRQKRGQPSASVSAPYYRHTPNTPTRSRWLGPRLAAAGGRYHFRRSQWQLNKRSRTNAGATRQERAQVEVARRQMIVKGVGFTRANAERMANCPDRYLSIGPLTASIAMLPSRPWMLAM